MFSNYTYARGQTQNYLSLVLRLHITNNIKEFMWRVRDSQCSIIIQNILMRNCWPRCLLRDWWLWIFTNIVSIPRSPFTVRWEHEWCSKIKHHSLHLKINELSRETVVVSLCLLSAILHVIFSSLSTCGISVYSCPKHLKENGIFLHGIEV